MFERPFYQSDVVLGCVVCSHLCVVNYTGGQAFVVTRALVFVTAIALCLVICIGVIVGISYFLVVFVDDRFHVCLLYTSPSPRDGLLSRMPSSA